MKSDDVAPAQAKAINAWLVPTMIQLLRLRQRMVEVGFPDDDPLLQLVTHAADATRGLSAELTAIEGRPAPPTWRQAYAPPPSPPPQQQ
jgi:hypothetical protein